MKTVTLYYREGSSDKVYQVWLEPVGGEFKLNFAYGRRGSALNAGTKTPSPVDEATAARLFAKLVQEKEAKGYTRGADGEPYHGNDSVESAGVRPQLLNPLAEDDLPRYLSDPDWCAQEKVDGKRLLLRKHQHEVQGINRRGLITPFPSPIAREAGVIDCDFLIDGECVGEHTYHAFDLLEQGGRSLRDWAYEERLAQLELLIGAEHLRCIRVLPTAFGEFQKGNLLRELRQLQAEGLVLKRIDAAYSPGRPVSGGPQLKCKFYATASCIVEEANPGKRSVRVGLFTKGKLVPAGSVSIPASAPLPRQGEVIEVRFLYAFKESGALYQPSFVGIRTDVDPGECTTDQLKYQSRAEAEDAPEEATALVK